MPEDKQGLFYRKYFLDRLASFLFAPRVAHRMELPAVAASGYHVLLPLGAGNLSQMAAEPRQQLVSRSIDVVRDLNLSGLAADRHLRGQYPSLPAGFRLVWGDNFIKALALAFIRRILSQRQVKRVVVATDHQDLSPFIDYMPTFGVPLSVQSYHPARYEPLAHQIMYDKGVAVSTSVFNPGSWERGDLVVVFEPEDRFKNLPHQSESYLQLNDDSPLIPPVLAGSLASYGLKTSLFSLASILEICLEPALARLAPAEKGLDHDSSQLFVAMEQAASSRGWWDLFLDKA